MFKNKCSLWCCLVIGFIVLAGVAVAEGSEKKDLLFVQDNIGDDKGPGYYQYPLDKRLKRGTFDIKSFKVTDDGDIVTFEIQMRNYIMREWPDSKKTGYQDFVANLWDIYIDIDGIPNSGYKYALPGRDLNFADNMGWEKMILVSPISEIELEEILNDKID
ncbi:MAG: glucodextranase DOMON-like domain-containing protein, partial [Candidatus Riflebacteria bacterium]|nr:glucodextranase DOMON-like domain-containing protein [Candidatus Riflebacteria bacterium]